MKNKYLRAALLILGFMMIPLFVVLLIGAPKSDLVVASSPVYNGQSAEAAQTQEVIRDSVVPLAAPAAREEVTFLETMSREEAPVVERTQIITPATPTPAVPTPAPEEPTVAPEEPSPAPEEPSPIPEEPSPAPEEPSPIPEEPSPAPEEPVVGSTAAIRLLERANLLLEQYNACTTMEQKRALLGASNNSLGNDAIRTKLLSDLGGSWELLEDEVVDATQYQQGKTLYVQVYFSDLSSDYAPVIYTTQNPDRSGNQWSTNLVYDDETAIWMEYTQKHAYNDSRVGFYMTTLYNNEDGWEELKDTMEASPVWEPVLVSETGDAPDDSEITVASEAPPAVEG